VNKPPRRQERQEKINRESHESFRTAILFCAFAALREIIFIMSS